MSPPGSEDAGEDYLQCDQDPEDGEDLGQLTPRLSAPELLTAYGLYAIIT